MADELGVQKHHTAVDGQRLERMMTRSWKQVGVVALACMLFSVLGATAGPDDNRTFVAHLSAAENVPTNASQAQGQAIFRLSKDGSTMSYKLIVANIENPTASHIHLAPPGANGAIQVNIFGGPSGTGRFDGILAEGSFLVTTSLLDAMKAGNTYINVHTNDGVAPTNTGPGDFPGGEIRGQIR